MKKMPIRWHEECLKNQEVNFKNDLIAFERRRVEIDRARKELEFSRLQLETAKSEGRDGYDPDRYLVKRMKGAIDGR